jgi:hypothetical protein
LSTALMQSGLPKMASRVLGSLHTTDSGSLTASSSASASRPARRPSPR